MEAEFTVLFRLAINETDWREREREREVYFPSDGANTIQCTNKSSLAQISKYKQARNTTSWD